MGRSLTRSNEYWKPFWPVQCQNWYISRLWSMLGCRGREMDVAIVFSVCENPFPVANSEFSLIRGPSVSDGQRQKGTPLRCDFDPLRRVSWHL